MHTVILVEPEIPENTGFIARLAANFEFSIHVVNPEFNLKEARKTAKNAQGKLRNALIFDSVEEAVSDLDYVIGTKPGRGIGLKDFQPRKNTSVMIGRESSGLTNDELELCDATVYLEASGYESLNQSHAAGIIMHSVAERSEEQGINSDQKKIVENNSGELTKELLLRANPSKQEAERLIAEIMNNQG